VLGAFHLRPAQPPKRTREQAFEADGGIGQSEELSGIPIDRVAARIADYLVELGGEVASRLGHRPVRQVEGRRSEGLRA
jgi:hypothetical protein